ncbi:probable cysteine--tRNA ligase, mitochondrial [Ornithodoros turicata]|uniref:probable cysteine--tRNA ligase, mitochondrial n=1 Tax=Ornithodoros turicata TaxID=34597 RepID=UPI00313969EF
MTSALTCHSRSSKRLIAYCWSTPRYSSAWRCPQGYDTGIKVYNTVVRKKVPLMVQTDGVIKWYACGPTVYDVAHVGHGCSYVRFDIIRRILEKFYNINVVMVMGITNVDDKIINRAREAGLPTDTIAKQYENEFLADMNRLRVLPPTMYMRVTENLDSITQFCATLKDKGMAYTADDCSMYFDVAKYPQYGMFRTECPEEQAQQSESKRDPRDFAVWKGAKPGEPKWLTPWGPGRPGWHIECSAMASQVFGSSVDIHTGGKDLMFPHHENEEAQSCSYHGVSQWVNYWLHAGHVQVKTDGKVEKMSKSLGNFIPMRQFLRDHSVNQFRIFCLRSPYQKDIELTPKTLDEARSTLRKMHDFVADAEAYVEGHLLCETPSEPDILERLAQLRKEVKLSLGDDFNYPKAISGVVKFINYLNQTLQLKPSSSTGARSPGAIAISMNYVLKLMEDLGVELTTKQSLQRSPYVSDSVLAGVLDDIVDFRNKVRLQALTGKQRVSEQQSPQDKHSPAAQETTSGYPVHPDRPPEDKEGDGSGWTAVPNAATKSPPQRKTRDPMIAACDVLRDRMFTAGIQIKDRGHASSWSFMEETSLEAKKEKLRSMDSFDPQYVPKSKGKR